MKDGNWSCWVGSNRLRAIYSNKRSFLSSFWYCLKDSKEHEKIKVTSFYNIQATFENATYCLLCFERREKEMTRFITKESNNFWGNHFFGTIFYSVDFYSKLISKKKNQILLNKIFCSKLLSYLWISCFSQTIIQFSNKPWKSYFKLLAYEGSKRSCFFLLKTTIKSAQEVGGCKC